MKKILSLLFVLSVLLLGINPVFASKIVTLKDIDPNGQLIIINKYYNKLAFYDNGKLVKTLSVATGRTSTLTPQGEFRIIIKKKNMPYYKTNIPGGDPRNPLGDRWLGLNVPGTAGYTYGIHGTNAPSSIGTYASSGCVRMLNEEVRWLFDRVEMNTPVLIVKESSSFNDIAERKGYINFEKYGIKDFLKIASEPEREVVKSLYDRKKLTGYDDGSFRPNGQITRAEFITMLSRVVDFGNKKAIPNFTDSKSSDWHYDVLENAYSNGILSGKSVNQYGVQIAPNDVITRQEMTVILVRLHEKEFGSINVSEQEIESYYSKYKDKNKVPSWAKEGIAKSLKAGITSGVETDRLGMEQKGTRVQSAVFSYRMLVELESKK